MNALDKIAELHSENVTFDGSFHYCGECKQPWPCPTRRLCDEASAEIVSQTDAHIAHLVHSLTAERDAARSELARTYKELLTKLDAARADAERLAADTRRVLTFATADPLCRNAFYQALSSLHASLAAHDALTGTEGQ